MNQKDHLGNTPLHKAAELGLVNTCCVLSSNGASPSILNNARSKPVDVATPAALKVLQQDEPVRGDSDVESQLLEAAKNGDLALVKVCI